MRVEIAIDVGSEIPADMREKQEAPTKPVAKPQAADDDGDYTSRLLAAKRRARREDDKPQGDGGEDKPRG